MAPPVAKSNFKSYEGQARLLRAMVAAHPEVKWNFKEIVYYYGEDTTEYALQHRFRALKAQASTVVEASKQGINPRHIPADLPAKKDEIARMFGTSTPDGIQWQFRTIKKDAESFKKAANSGGDPSKAVDLGLPAVGTPRGKANASNFTTPSSKRSRAPTSGRSAPSTSKRQKTQSVRKPSLGDGDDEEDDEDDVDISDYKALDDTPSKPQKHSTPTAAGCAGSTAATGSIFGKPSRAATSAAAAAISQQSIDLTSDDEAVQTPTESTNMGGGPVSTKTDAKPNGTASHTDYLLVQPSETVSSFATMSQQPALPSFTTSQNASFGTQPTQAFGAPESVASPHIVNEEDYDAAQGHFDDQFMAPGGTFSSGLQYTYDNIEDEI